MEPIIALLVVTVAYAIGDIIGTRSKATIPSVFVIACLFLAGYWTFFPQNIIDLAGMGQPLGGLAIYMCITHMGTIISFRELLKQWRIIVICLAGLTGMALLVWFICMPIVGREYVVAGLPPLTGGIVAALMMQQRCLEKGLETAAVLSIVMYAMQGFFGYPLTAFFLKKEANRLLACYDGKLAVTKDNEQDQSEKEIENKRKLFPPIPDTYNTTAVILARMSSVAVVSYLIGRATGGKLNACVVALLLSIFCTEIGYLDKNSLQKAGSFGFLMLVLMIFVFGGLANATPLMLKQIVVPLVTIIIVGVIGMGIFSVIVGKLLNISPYIAFASSLTALYGFPPNYVLTEETVKATAKTPDEYKYLMDEILPQMIVGGFTTVTIASVIIAGIFVNLL